MNTLKRNGKRVGNNCASYTNKHPTNPVPMRPIHDALSVGHSCGKLIRELKSLGSQSKPAILQFIRDRT
jgi:hypothetical protein